MRNVAQVCSTANKRERKIFKIFRPARSSNEHQRVLSRRPKGWTEGKHGRQLRPVDSARTNIAVKERMRVRWAGWRNFRHNVYYLFSLARLMCVRRRRPKWPRQWEWALFGVPYHFQGRVRQIPTLLYKIVKVLPINKHQSVARSPSLMEK